jgi:hypothetical protein
MVKKEVKLQQLAMAMTAAPLFATKVGACHSRTCTVGNATMTRAWEKNCIVLLQSVPHLRSESGLACRLYILMMFKMNVDIK